MNVAYIWTFWLPYKIIDGKIEQLRYTVDDVMQK
jgi:hypothetical protein